MNPHAKTAVSQLAPALLFPMTFCTYFDHHYLDRGLVLYESLRKHCPGGILRVLALSKECEEFLLNLNLDGLVIIRLEEITRDEPLLLEAKKARTAAEFIFTLTPFLVLHVFESVGPGEQVTYLDADMMFFGSPSAIVEQSNNYDVSITPHNFSPHMRGQQRFGIYNVGWVGFRKTTGGVKCARWWAERCLEWCYDRVEDGKFGDQKYLEGFADIADALQVIACPGINCAPWNASFREFSSRRGQVYVDDQPLVLFHFPNVKRINAWCLATRLKQQAVLKARGLRREVYVPYARMIAGVTKRHRIPSSFVFDTTKRRVGSRKARMRRDDNPGIGQIMYRLMTNEYIYCHGCPVN